MCVKVWMQHGRNAPPIFLQRPTCEAADYCFGKLKSRAGTTVEIACLKMA
jgi:hypothetical protein